MGELILVTPIIDIRETFIPSEMLRDALVDNLLAPDLDKKTVESLRAAFLFKSWRRRAIEKDDYILNERDRDSSLRAASLGFRALVANALRFDGNIGIGPDGLKKRFVFGVFPDSNLTKVNEVLDGIPTIEDKKQADIGRGFVYVDIDSESIVNGSFNITEGVAKIHARLVHQAYARHHYITPDRIVAKETILRTKFVSDDSSETSSV